MRKFGLIGYPLSHSFSPAFFAEKFAAEGITDCTYNSYPIESINCLTSLLADNPELLGLNVTIPYKKQVIQFLDDSTDAVKQMYACNCIKINSGKLVGYNTDVAGFQRSLTPLLTPLHTKALVLGTGGAAAAVEFVLNQLAIDFLFVSRSQQQIINHITYEDVTADLLKEYKLIINTTPLGMYPDVNDCPALPFAHLTSSHYLYDLVYNPAETLFLKNGAAMGAVTKNGSDMLVIQAEESWRIWNDSTM